MYELDDDRLDSLGTSVDELAAIGRLLDQPRLAYIWYALYVEGNVATRAAEGEDVNPFLWDGLTIAQLEQHVDVPQSTLYNDVAELVDLGAAEVRSDDQPKGYKAVFLEAENEIVDVMGEDPGLVNPPLLGLVGQAYTDEAVEAFIDEHGYDALADARAVYRQHLIGDLDFHYTEIMHDIPDSELEAIVPALRHIFAECSRDPLWTYDYSDELAATRSS